MNEAIISKIAARAASPVERGIDGAYAVRISRSELRDVARFLRDECGFDYLVFMTALDRAESGRIELVYRLFSYGDKAALVIRTDADRSAPVVDTISDIFPASEWHERETADMFGIAFTGHPDPRPILLPDGFTGFPLRKDFMHENMISLPEA